MMRASIFLTELNLKLKIVVVDWKFLNPEGAKGTWAEALTNAPAMIECWLMPFPRLYLSYRNFDSLAHQVELVAML